MPSWFAFINTPAMTEGLGRARQVTDKGCQCLSKCRLCSKYHSVCYAKYLTVIRSLRKFHSPRPVCEKLCISLSPLLSQVRGCGLTWQTTRICSVNAESCTDYGYNRGGKVADECGSLTDDIKNLFDWTDWWVSFLPCSQKCIINQ